VPVLGGAARPRPRGHRRKAPGCRGMLWDYRLLKAASWIKRIF
jgi:hypothetical protein